MISEFVAIDPLALLLPTSVYLAIQEKINPHQPVISVLNEALKSLSPADKASIQARIHTLNTYTGAVQEALGARTAGAKS
jgi:hypothetical protein